MLRTPPSSVRAPSSAPPMTHGGVFIFTAAGSKEDTPKRSRDPDSPTSAQRKTPPKKNKSSTPPSVLLVELGDILDEILYMVEEKKPAVRHINMDMKERLRRMKQIHQEVSAKLEKVPVSPQRTERCTNISVSHETNRDGPVRRTTEAQPEIHVIDTTPPPEKPKWQKVVKRPKQLKHNSRPDAVMIKCKEKEAYAQVLKAVHGDGALQEYKDKVSGIRRTAAGEVLLRMTKASDETTGKLQKAIQSLIGDRGEVKALADKVALEIRTHLHILKHNCSPQNKSSATPMGCAVTYRNLHSNSPSRTRFLRRSCNAPLNAVKMQKEIEENKRNHRERTK
ncbi:hypothetical protein ACLKA6_005759 [Drosophila palustris]